MFIWLRCICNARLSLVESCNIILLMQGILDTGPLVGFYHLYSGSGTTDQLASFLAQRAARRKRPRRAAGGFVSPFLSSLVVLRKPPAALRGRLRRAARYARRGRVVSALSAPVIMALFPEHSSDALYLGCLRQTVSCGCYFLTKGGRVSRTWSLC